MNKKQNQSDIRANVSPLIDVSLVWPLARCFRRQALRSGCQITSCWPPCVGSLCAVPSSIVAMVSTQLSQGRYHVHIQPAKPTAQQRRQREKHVLQRGKDPKVSRRRRRHSNSDYSRSVEGPWPPKDKERGGPVSSQGRRTVTQEIKPN